MDQNPNQSDVYRLGPGLICPTALAEQVQAFFAQHGIPDPFSVRTSPGDFTKRVGQFKSKHGNALAYMETFEQKLYEVNEWMYANGVNNGVFGVSRDELRANLNTLAEHLKAQGKNSCNAEIIQLTAQRDDWKKRAGRRGSALILVEDWLNKHGSSVLTKSFSMADGDLNSALNALANHLKAQGRKEAEGEIAELKRSLEECKRVRDASIAKNLVVNDWARAHGVTPAYSREGADAIKSSLAAIEAKLIGKGRAEEKAKDRDDPHGKYALDRKCQVLNKLGDKYNVWVASADNSFDVIHESVTKLEEAIKAKAVQEYKAQLASERAERSTKRLKDMIEGGHIDGSGRVWGMDLGKSWGVASFINPNPYWGKTAAMSQEEVSHRINVLESDVSDIKAKLSEPVKVTVTVDGGGEA